MSRQRKLKNQIIGLVRFSYPSLNGFQRTYGSIDAQMDALFNSDRMSFRFKMLRSMCAHSLRNQTDKDFKIIFLVGEAMPAAYLTTLENEISTIRGAEIIALPRLHSYASARKAFAPFIDDDADMVTTFRMDDDDAVAIDFIEKLRVWSEVLINAGLVVAPTAVSYNRGIYWSVGETEGQMREVREFSPLGLACAMITTRDMPKNIYRHNHRRLGAFGPTYMDPTDWMFIRTVHEGNDSGEKKTIHGRVMEPEQAENVVQRRFRLDPDMFYPPE